MKRWGILLVLALGLAAGAFYYLTHRGPKALTVEEVLQRSAELDGRRVCVQGKVKRPLAALGAGYFQLEGQSGAVLHVVSSAGVPPQGTKSTVCGTFREAYRLGTLSLRVLLTP